MASSLALATPSSVLRSSSRPDPREYYELRRFAFANVETRDRFTSYLEKAYTPAARRAGAGPVGLFAPVDDPKQPAPFDVYVLLVFPTLEGFAAAGSKMAVDEQYHTSGAFVLDLPPTDPPYQHNESSLLVAFTGSPQHRIPRETADGKPRVFELRSYESHSRKANRKKIEMFNVGEAEVFRRNGFQPVFFGETLVGPQVPNLTYMVTYPSVEERGSFWQKFGADPDMKRLFAVPEYNDKLIVSKIRTVMLRPLPGSQI